LPLTTNLRLLDAPRNVLIKKIVKANITSFKSSYGKLWLRCMGNIKEK